MLIGHQNGERQQLERAAKLLVGLTPSRGGTGAIRRFDPRFFAAVLHPIARGSSAKAPGGKHSEMCANGWTSAWQRRAETQYITRARQSWPIANRLMLARRVEVD